ncbi:hypothetical protein OESDEN_17448, partial [Oesophagostomum dentatum]
LSPIAALKFVEFFFCCIFFYRRNFFSVLQSNLPSSSGTASSKLEPRAALEAFYDRYTKESSRKDYRFWVMARLLRPIAVGENSSFAAMIAPEGSSREEVAASCSEWLNSHWRAAELRPLASTLLVSATCLVLSRSVEITIDVHRRHSAYVLNV